MELVCLGVIIGASGMIIYGAYSLGMMIMEKLW